VTDLFTRPFLWAQAFQLRPEGAAIDGGPVGGAVLNSMWPVIGSACRNQGGLDATHEAVKRLDQP